MIEGDITGQMLVENCINPSLTIIKEHWESLEKEFECESTPRTIDQIIKEEPNSQLAKLWSFLTELKACLAGVDSPATGFEIVVCEHLMGIVRELDSLGEDSEAF